MRDATLAKTDTVPENEGESATSKEEVVESSTVTCKKCGVSGLKHQFFGKTKKFCSYTCSKAEMKSQSLKVSWKMKAIKRSASASSKSATPAKRPKIDLKGSFEWKSYLERPDFTAAPVSCFKHVALSDCWDYINVGTKLEIEYKSSDGSSCFWIASVVKVAGYMALLRYEGFGSDSSKDFWVNMCTQPMYPVGWCCEQGIPLTPLKSLENKHIDWKQFFQRRLTGCRTLPSNFCAKVQESLNNRIQHGMTLEVVDKNRISSVRVAKVDEVVGGRLHVSYEAAEEGDEGFWCHERSPLIHPVGWAQVIGHDLRATVDYAVSSLQKTLYRTFDPDDATWDLFMPVRNPPTDMKFKVGMKLEAIDPLNLSTVCVATVTRVLRNNYLMIGIDGMMAANGSDWFCYHASSPCIFPVGFCELNNITLTPPRGYRGEFKWSEYLKQTKSTAAPVGLFKKEIPDHGFKEGMHVEAVDLMEPRLICVGSVTKVVGRLLRVHFDGWDDAYDQWCDCESPDLFPVGWCQVVGYKLEPPRTEVSPETSKKKKKTYSAYKGARKKKKKFSFLGSKTFTYKISPKGNLKASPKSEKKADSGLNNQVTQVTDPSSSPSATNTVDSTERRETVSQDVSKKLFPEPESSVSFFDSETNPKNWSILDVAQFLRINECGSYCQAFSQQRIDGQKFITMNKDDLMTLMGMKVGPALKISHLIQQLRQKLR